LAGIYQTRRKGPGFLGFLGNWKLSDNIITLDVIPIETMSYSTRTIIIDITIINRENIIFTYEDGTVEKLNRSNNTDKKFF
jgi:hypothetical protein